MRSLAAGVALFLLGITRRRCARADHARDRKADPVSEQFSECRAHRVIDARRAAFQFPVHHVGRQRVAFEHPAGELLHVARAQVHRPAVLADRRRVHHEPKHHGRGLIAGKQQPEFIRLPRGRVEHEPIHTHIVKRHQLQKAQIAALPDHLRQMRARGRFALVQQRAMCLQKFPMRLDLPREIRFMPAGGENFRIATIPICGVTGNHFRSAVRVQARAPLRLQRENRLAAAVTPPEPRQPLRGVVQEFRR